MNLCLTALRLLLALTVLTGVVYPLAITGLARLAFARQAEGSPVRVDGRVVGSALIAQRFTNALYFWPRPSAGDYAAVPSAASNLGPTSRLLLDTARRRAASLRLAHGLPADAPVPPELVLASGSGLDPHLSPPAARFQVARVARARGFNIARTAALARLVEERIEPPQLGFIGPARVNVLRLNLALDQLP
jgi:K+-transporting ATPase ATPase C chain